MISGFGLQRVIIFAIFIEVTLFFLPILGQGNIAWAAVLPPVMVELANKERESQNLSKLVVNPVLNAAAQAKAVDMASYGYFAHTSPEGRTPWYWFGLAGYRYQDAGENLAVNFSDSENVIRAWMKSPTHRANIVNENYTEIGTGIAFGFYEGKETIFVAQVYGNPLQHSKVKKNSPPPPKISVKSETPATKKINKQVNKKPSTEVLGAEAKITPASSTLWQKVALLRRIILIGWSRIT